MGRHGGHVDGSRGRWVATAAVVALVLGIVGWRAWVVVAEDGSILPAIDAFGCDDQAVVSVVTTPAIEPVVRELVDDVGGCATYRVTAEPTTATAARFSSGSGETPMVWVPDSTAVAELVAGSSGEKLRVGASIAATPVVVVVPADLTPPEPLSWGSVVFAETTRLPDPNNSAVGQLALMSGLAEVDARPAEQRRAALAGIGGMLSRVVPEATLFTSHTSGSDPAVFPATEQQVAASGVSGLTLAVPGTGVQALDFPLVSSTSAPEEAVDALEAAFTSSRGQQALRDRGFRTPADLEPVVAGAPPASAMRSRPSVTPSAAEGAYEMWQAVTKPTRLLTVIDTSGSMRQPAGSGRESRIQIAAQAATGAIDLLADQNSVGLWTFSTRQRGEQDWTQLQPIQALGREDHRAKLAFSLGSLGSRLGGDTGLYDTLDAAYAKAIEEYDPRAANLVTLFTDGVNDDPSGGLSLEQLRTRLAEKADPEKPVTVLLVGMGGVDQTQLRTVAAAVPTGERRGAAVFAIDTAEDIADVYVTMLLRRLPQRP
ncbi:MAG: VWA domain-containing protein [Dermatophilaceae bacterium]